jgi:hypothetical protein
MSIKVVSIDELRRQRSQGTFETSVPYRLNGAPRNITKRMVNGEMDGLTFVKPIGEMITTAAGRQEMVEKVVLDVELGREAVPTLYTPIYENITDPNFPEVFDAKWAMHGVVVFLEHMEGEEVKFGHLEAEKGPVARITTYAAGFEYTEDMQVYNRTFEVEMLDRAFGEAYNALLNHIHLSPFTTYSYAAGNKTGAVYVDSKGVVKENATGAHPVLSLRETIKAGLAAARAAKRPGNVLLISGTKLDHVREAIGSIAIDGTVYPSLTGIDQIIAYDGWDIKVGKRSYAYAGVNEAKAYIIRPRRGFKELVKHDLLVDANMGDLSRLVEAQVVGRARRGLFCAIPENVQEITLPSFS